MNAASAEQLKQNALDLIEASRKRLSEGEVDVLPVEAAVRAYCEAIGALPLEEGRHFAQDLTSLMEAVTALGNDLVAVRDVVRKEMGALSKHKQANVAYHKSEAMAEKNINPEGES